MNDWLFNIYKGFYQSWINCNIKYKKTLWNGVHRHIIIIDEEEEEVTHTLRAGVEWGRQTRPKDYKWRRRDRRAHQCLRFDKLVQVIWRESQEVWRLSWWIVREIINKKQGHWELWNGRKESVSRRRRDQREREQHQNEFDIFDTRGEHHGGLQDVRCQVLFVPGTLRLQGVVLDYSWPKI